jgi:hypothetical protein
VLVFNSDGGSADGTCEQVLRARDVGGADHGLALLRTIHRIVAPYHGLPGKPAALGPSSRLPTCSRRGPR